MGTSKITGVGVGQGSNNKPIGCGVPGAYAPGSDNEEEEAFGIPECITNVDTLDLFFRRPDDDSIQSKHVAIM